MFTVPSEQALVRLALDLGAADFGGPLSVDEERVLGEAERLHATSSLANAAADLIVSGGDPLGDAFCALRSAAIRRQSGAVYTPFELILPMVNWVLEQSPVRVVDAGTGSGRFTLAVARRKPDISLVAIDLDPIATLMTRAALAVLDCRNVRVMQSDYTALHLEPVDGRTGFIGNPPYVRHHGLAPAAKAWARAAALASGHKISGLAGLHTYFYLATSLLAQPDDVGCFVTSSEWLDVNYGSIVRELLLDNLGGQAIHVIEPRALPFGDTATTATISCFHVAQPVKSVRLHAVESLPEIGDLEAGQPVARERLAATSRWSTFVRTASTTPEGYVELGEICRVHRGAVTGRNAIWVTGCSDHRLPRSVLFASVTKARELFAAGGSINSIEGLRQVIDLPEDLDSFDRDDRQRIELFLHEARRAGAAEGYIARNRRAWWSVGLREPAPILATYMARRPPAFVRNLANVRHINIAHGLYPREPLTEKALDRLAQALNGSASTSQGRTYAGGLTKFEPREMERLPVPDLSMLLA